MINKSLSLKDVSLKNRDALEKAATACTITAVTLLALNIHELLMVSWIVNMLGTLFWIQFASLSKLSGLKLTNLYLLFVSLLGLCLNQL